MAKMLKVERCGDCMWCVKVPGEECYWCRKTGVRVLISEIDELCKLADYPEKENE